MVKLGEEIVGVDKVERRINGGGGGKRRERARKERPKAARSEGIGGEVQISGVIVTHHPHIG